MFKYFSLVSKEALESRFYTLKSLRRKSKNKGTKKILDALIRCGEAFVTSEIHIAFGGPRP